MGSGAMPENVGLTEFHVHDMTGDGYACPPGMLGVSVFRSTNGTTHPEGPDSYFGPTNITTFISVSLTLANPIEPSPSTAL